MATEQLAKPMDFRPLLAHLEPPTGVIKVLYPACGIMSSKVFEEAFGLKTHNLGAYDVEEKYRKVLSEVVLPHALHLGVAGDITKVDLQSLPIPHYVIGGPPCPPWAGNGKKG